MIDEILNEMIGLQITTANRVDELQERESAGIFTAVRTVGTGFYNVVSTDGTLFCDISGGSITLTLASAVNRAGRLFIIKHVAGAFGVNNITVNTSAGQTIDGAASYVFTTAYEVIRLQSDGVNWYTV